MLLPSNSHYHIIKSSNKHLHICIFTHLHIFTLISRSTIQLLRFPFSLFLLPVYLFALSQVPSPDWGRAAQVFVILHGLVYPASNGYNSYMDRDETPIGGLQRPMQPTRQLFFFTMVMDGIALLWSFLLSPFFAAGLLLYILASRAYSYRGTRLKAFPIAGFLTVFLFQGGWIFFHVYALLSGGSLPPLSSCLAASLLIGALYPLTQIYQHEADRKDGVTTLSYLLGKRGSFVFSMLQFLAATALFYRLFMQAGKPNHFWLYLFMLLPVVLFFLYWMRRVWQHGEEANFRNSLRMNGIATLCTTLFFITLIVLNH